MSVRLAVCVLLGACSSNVVDLPVSSVGTPLPPDAGTTPDAAPRIQCDTPAAPDGGLSFSSGPTPSSTAPSVAWTPTGAPGCESVLATDAPSRRSWTAPDTHCYEGPPVVDGQGDLAFGYDDNPCTSGLQAFFPAAGSAGLVMHPSPTEQPLGLIPRPEGFFVRSVDPISPGAAWARPRGPAGRDEGIVRAVDSSPEDGLWPDPRGGFVEGRIVSRGAELGFDVRWVDVGLDPRTPWQTILSWKEWTLHPALYVDALGKVLLLAHKDYALSQPCSGDDAVGVWASEDGEVLSFAPVTPTFSNDICSGPSFGGFGTPVALDDGGFAFYHPPDDWLDISPTGWYARYASGSGVADAPPAWLLGYEAVQRVADGRAYLAMRRDAASCARAAELVSPSGTVCATLPLDASGDCNAAVSISPDGTAVLRVPESCSVTWWPGLGRLR